MRIVDPSPLFVLNKRQAHKIILYYSKMILLKYLLIYISFSIFLQLFEVESQTALKPDIRTGHTATFINYKLYILGGSIPNSNLPPKGTFFYLDFSTPFNTNGLNWNDLSATVNNIFPPHRYASAIKGGANNSTLFLYGGDNFSGQPMGLIYTFDIQNNLWSVPKITGIPPTGKVSISPVIDYNGLMYLFGGVTSEFNGAYTNDMFVLDTINLSWKKVNSINAPGLRVQYSAVYLPNKNIIYMGGYNKNFGAFPLNEVYLYDTTNDIWTIKTTIGLNPSARYSFSSILGLDGQKVIIFGGFDTNLNALSPENSLYVLDLNNFNWYIPKVTGNIPLSRSFHKLVLIGKYMVITFGNEFPPGVDNVLLLDISNNDEYIWTTSFVPSSPPAPSSSVPLSPNPSTTSTQFSTNTNTSSSTNNTGVIVGSVVGSLFGILLTIGSFFLYRRYKNIKEQNHAVPTPGERGSYPQEILRIPSERTTYYQDQQAPFQPTYYNHGQATIPIYGNTGSLAQQNVDQNALQNLIVREEVDNRVTRNFNQGRE